MPYLEDPILSRGRYDYWKKSGTGILRNTHVALGNQAVVDGSGPVNSFLQDTFGAGTYSSVISQQEIMTGTANVWNIGLMMKTVLNTSTNPTLFAGMENTTATAAGSTVSPVIGAGLFNNFIHRGTGTIFAAYGEAAAVNNKSTGTINTVYGVNATLSNDSTGTITNAYSFIAKSLINIAGGTVLNNYGVFIEDQSGAGSVSNYNLYSSGTGSSNMLEGTLKINTQSGHSLSSTTESWLQTLTDENNAAADAMYISPSTQGGGRLYIGKSGRAIYAMNMKYVQHFEEMPFVLSSYGGYDGYIIDATRSAFAMVCSTYGYDLLLGTPGTGFITGAQNTGAGWRRDIRFKSWAADSDTMDSSAATSNYIFDTNVTNSTFQHSKFRENGNDIFNIEANGQLSVSPRNRTFTAGEAFIRSNNTYTLNFSNAISPIGYDYNPTVIYQQDGFGFGSGILFWARPTIQNDSASTRSIGPWVGFGGQPVYQANGGTFTGQAADFVSNATFNRINSGTLSFSNHFQFWAQGGTVGTGATVTNRFGFYASGGIISGTLTSEAGFVSTALTGTNKTHVLLGTGTIPSGNWGIYQSSTETNLFSGDIQLIKEAARTIQIQDSTTSNTAGAALSILSGKGKGTAAGGALNLTGGAADTAGVGGAVNLTGGLGTNLSKGGNVNILSGNGFTGGDVKIDVGTGFAGAKILIGTARGVQTGFGQGTPTALIHIGAGTTAASTAPLKFTSGTNMTTAETGAVEYDGTNLFFTRTGTTRETLWSGNSGATAPGTTATPTFTSYYGGNTKALGDPNSWASVVIGGTTYKIPLYT